ncbi:hypothetical protein NGRA_1817 [Nosema granulosis]|uniref:Uncharacterized protein n=1 Tax=Nosema granulosis TaxID=83296 RepID=A0A9P6KZ87_9MICR|nr:hypothetical protein NGRA_1817 [Nosema granulosis]
MRICLFIGLILSSILCADNFNDTHSQIVIYQKYRNELQQLCQKKEILKILDSRSFEEAEDIKKILDIFSNLCRSKEFIGLSFLKLIDMDLFNLSRDEKNVVVSMQMFRDVFVSLRTSTDCVEVLRKELNRAVEKIEMVESIDYNDGLSEIEEDFVYVYLSCNKDVPSFMSKNKVRDLYFSDYVSYVYSQKEKFYLEYNGSIFEIKQDQQSLKSNLKFINSNDSFLITPNFNLDNNLNISTHSSCLVSYIRLLKILSRLYLRSIALDIKTKEDSQIELSVKISHTKKPVQKIECRSTFDLHKQRHSSIFRSCTNINNVAPCLCKEIPIFNLVRLSLSMVSHRDIQKKFDIKTNLDLKKELIERFKNFQEEKRTKDEPNSSLAYIIRRLRNFGLIKKIIDKIHTCGDLRELFVELKDQYSKLGTSDILKTVENMRLGRGFGCLADGDIVKYITCCNDRVEISSQPKFKEFIQEVGVGKMLIGYLEWFHLPLFFKDLNTIILYLQDSARVFKKKINEIGELNDVTVMIKNKKDEEKRSEWEEPNEFSPFFNYGNILIKNIKSLSSENLNRILLDSLIYLISTGKVKNEDGFKKVYISLLIYLETLFKLLRFKNLQSYTFVDTWRATIFNRLVELVKNKVDVTKLTYTKYNPVTDDVCLVLEASTDYSKVKNVTSTSFSALKEYPIRFYNEQSVSVKALDGWIEFLLKKHPHYYENDSNSVLFFLVDHQNMTG